MNAAQALRCHECKRPTNGTLLREQHPQSPSDSAYFVAPLCERPECREKARKKGAMFA